MNLFHFDEDLSKIDFWNYKKFGRCIEKSTFLHQNGTSSLIAPSNGLLHQTPPSEGATSELAPYLIIYDDFSSQLFSVVTFLFCLMTE